MTISQAPWSVEDTQVLIDSWPTKISFSAMSRLLSVPRTVGSIKNHGYNHLRLGKRQSAKPSPARQELSPWPSDMRFVDDERTITDRLGRRYIALHGEGK